MQVKERGRKDVIDGRYNGNEEEEEEEAD